jgi:prepilin-type N-terminal cleavage/methylation domain-containing protein
VTPCPGFTLTELAVVLAIIGLLLGSLLLTMSTQVEQRKREDTQRRLEEARDLLVAFALVNRRLPCPATGAAGDESFAASPPAPAGACTTNYGGFLPARTIGSESVDPQGFALDAWGNRIRYAVSATSWGPTPPPPPPARFTKQHVAGDPTAAWNIGTVPGDLVICSAAAPGASCLPGTSVTNQNVVVLVVFSTGKNAALGAGGANEQENLDGDAVFVSRPPDPADAVGGEFDDMLVWVPVGLLYSRMISAGVLP